MQHFYFFIVGVVIVSIIHNTNSYQKEDLNTSWICGKNDKCIRQESTNNLTNIYETQNICRLTCGRYGALWPRPTGSTLLGKNVIHFQPDRIRFNIEDIPPNLNDYMEKVTQIFIENVCKECGANCKQHFETDVVVKISIETNEEHLTWTTDESYRLDITTTDNEVDVHIYALTVFGGRHGLETLSQLITQALPVKDVNGLVILANAQIKDRPIFSHRGLMLDTARNFIPINDIKRTIDAMGSSKLNVLHWHATDSQSFPLEIPNVPQMTRYGAYSHKQIYRYVDTQDIIKYAHFRGIRVILEIDAPSHSGNGWQWGPDYDFGDLAVCVNQQPWRNYCIQPPCGQLNPVNTNVYKVLRNIYKDLLGVLPITETIHMGGDEVHFGCWNSTQEIIDLLVKQGHGRTVSDFLQLWSEFQASALQIWDSENENSPRYKTKQDPPGKVILWSSQLTEIDNIEKYLPKERYIIQTWVESHDKLVTQLLTKGYSLIVSTKNAWYFDHGFWGTTKYYTWRDVYTNKIPRLNGVLGGEACVWSELIDESTLDSRAWPRAAAVAERLWTNPEITTVLAELRFFRHYERLKTKGIKAEAIAPTWCLKNEGGCY